MHGWNYVDCSKVTIFTIAEYEEVGVNSEIQIDLLRSLHGLHPIMAVGRSTACLTDEL